MTESHGSYDIPTVIAGTALLTNIATSAFFYNKIQTLESELAEVKKHLATIVPTVDPNMRNQITNIIKAVNTLDHRIQVCQKDIHDNINDIKAIKYQKGSKDDDDDDDEEEVSREIIPRRIPKRQYSRVTECSSSRGPVVSPGNYVPRYRDEELFPKEKTITRGEKGGKVGRVEKEEREERGERGKGVKEKVRFQESSVLPASAVSAASVSSEEEFDESDESDTSPDSDDDQSYGDDIKAMM